MSGVTIIENSPVRHIEVRQNKLVSIDTADKSISADKYVLSAGAWSGAVNFQSNLDIKPVRGQMLCYQLPERWLDAIILVEDRYVIPRKDNIVLVGSTVEEVGFNAETTAEANQELHEFVCRILPEFKQLAPIKQWAGLRPKTTLGLPAIGAHPELENLYINCGHYRNGLLAAPASAELLADIMLQRQTKLDSLAFSPANIALH